MVDRSDRTTNIDRLRALLREQGVIRVRDLATHGISQDSLWRLHRRGEVIRVARGLYVPVDYDSEPAHTVAEAAKRVPQGIVCLLSALRLHDLTTQSPHAVWLTIPVAARRPKVEYPPIEIVRASGPALSEGIEERVIEGITVRIYNPAKTVADCFKNRNKAGLDVAIEALRDCLDQRRATLDQIWRYAEICRVANVIRPYVEAIA
jgi:predicted transcriptional regulator of viral defense system